MNNLPYRIDPRIKLRATGRWENGGVLEFTNGSQFLGLVDLPAAEWCLVGLLIEAALRSQATGSANAFLTTKELFKELERRTGLGAQDSSNLTRYIYKLRIMLGKALARFRYPGAASHPIKLGKLLVERHRFLGYRISLPPANLQLEVLGRTAAKA